MRAGRRHRLALFALLAGAACGPRERRMVLPADTSAPDRHDDPPVAVNAETPVEYPPALFEQGIEGNVVLRLHTDEEGRVVPESTKVAESSGYPALDSAALLGAPQLKFAPAQRNGAAVSATFLQPVHFRHPPRAGTTP